PSFDQVIPMYKLRKSSESKPDKDQHVGRVSFILVQDKARARTASKTDVDSVSLKGTELPTLGQPYIAILADLRATTPGVKFWPRNEGGVPVLRILASGLGKEAYRFLGKQEMLSVCDILKSIVHLPELTHGLTPDEMKVTGRLRFGSTTKDENMLWR
ncbi:hypothetical protein FRC10_004483, partial [Ceratobasidium sp. 414]